jgi:hypothetical protein
MPSTVIASTIAKILRFEGALYRRLLAHCAGARTKQGDARA